MSEVPENRFDQLTGLSNRASLVAHLEHLVHGNSPHQLIVIDLDRFKHFNMHNGHVAGDGALVSLGSFIATTHPTDCAAFRPGGDEFVLVLQSDNRERAVNLAERIRAFVADELGRNQPDHCGDNDCLGPAPMSCSLAIVPLKPLMSSAELLQEADDLLFQAKREGGNSVRFRH